MEPPLMAALFHFAHIRKEVAKRQQIETLGDSN
jgi:hypothetical protein